MKNEMKMTLRGGYVIAERGPHFGEWHVVGWFQSSLDVLTRLEHIEGVDLVAWSVVNGIESMVRDSDGDMYWVK